MTAIFIDNAAWKYWNVCERQRNVIKGYAPLYYHNLGRNNVDHMASTADKILQNEVYYREQKNKTFEI